MLTAARTAGRARLLGAITALAFAVAVASLWPGSAHAGTRVSLGQLSPADPSQCLPTNMVQASVGGAPPYSAPSDGVITAWSHRAHDTTPGTGRLQVWRPAEGTSYTLVGRSPERAFVAGEVNTFSINIPVKAGDTLGFSPRTTLTGCFFAGGAGDRVRIEPIFPRRSGAVASGGAGIGETKNLSGILGAMNQDLRLNVSAVFEPTIASNEFTFGKLKLNKKRGTAKLTVKLPGAGKLKLKKSKTLKGQSKSPKKAGKTKLNLKPKGKAKRKLASNGKAKVKAKITYTPSGGEPDTKTKKVKLKKRG